VNRHLLVVVLIMGLALAACGGGSGGGSESAEAVPAESIVVTPTPMGTLTVPPGATIELTVNGPVPLEVTINAGEPVLFVLKDDEYGQSTVQFDDRKVGTMLWLLPGQSRIFARLTDKDPGTYTYKMLTRPDNKGTIIVK
jgi:ABC-type transport system substrate-binding protein